MRRFRLKQPFLVTRALGCLALAAGVSTLGVALTVAVAAIPLLLFSLVFGASTASGSFALVLAFVTWIAVAGAVSVWALRAAGLILQHRIPAGYVALGDDGVCFRRFLRLRYVVRTAREKSKRPRTLRRSPRPSGRIVACPRVKEPRAQSWRTYS